MSRRTCACGRVALGPLGTPRIENGIEHRWGRPCRPERETDNETTPPPEVDHGR